MKRLILLVFFFPILLFAQDSTLQHYNNLLKDYKRGKRDLVVMPYLAYTARSIKEDGLAHTIANDYIENYLLKLKGDRFYSMANIEFVWQFTQGSADKAFRLFYENGDKIDKNIGMSGYSRNHVDFIIAKEEIDARLWKNNDPNQPVSDQPDWPAILDAVKKKYNNDYAQRTVINAKIRWYDYKNDSAALAKSYVEKFDKYGLDTLGPGKYMVNNIIYNYIFKYSDDPADLRKGLKWMELLMRSSEQQPGFMDTYANLLYKLGNKVEALRWQEKAMALAPRDEEIRMAWNQMKNGKPTWVVNME